MVLELQPFCMQCEVGLKEMRFVCNEVWFWYSLRTGLCLSA